MDYLKMKTVFIAVDGQISHLRDRSGRQDIEKYLSYFMFLLT